MKKLVSVLAVCAMLTCAFVGCGSSDSSSDSSSKASTTEASTEETTEASTEEKTTEATTEEKTTTKKVTTTEKATEEETEEKTEEESEEGSEEATEEEASEAETENKLEELNTMADNVRKAALSVAVDIDAAGKQIAAEEGKSIIISSADCSNLADPEEFLKTFSQYINLNGNEFFAVLDSNFNVKIAAVAESWDSTEVGIYPVDETNGATLQQLFEAVSQM